MASNPAQGGGSPQKPWEQAGNSSGPSPFSPPSAGNTSDVVEASGTARPGEIVSAADRSATVARNTVGRSVPARPWEQQQTYGGNTYGGGSTYGGYGSSGLGYSGYGSGAGMYGSSYGGGLGSYGGASYGGGMYNRGGYGGGMYGGSSMYGGGMGMGMGMGGGYGMGMGMGMGQGPYGDQDPNNPYGAPSEPPGFWISFLRVMQGVVNFFGRISILIDQNTQAFHLFMTAMLQLFDRGGLLYGELARFVLRILGVKTKPRKMPGPPGPNGLPGPHNPHGNQNFIEGPKAPPSGGWDNVWGDN